MDVEKLKCVLCQRFPDAEVYECAAQHIGCKGCVDKLNVRLCKCSEYFDNKKGNPIEQLLAMHSKTPCPYKSAGCTWVFGPQDMRLHLKECKYRPYRCIGSKLSVISCNWSGLQRDIEEHLRNDHAILGKPFSYYQESEIPFSAANSRGSIKLVDAFSKQFLFYFSSNVATKMVYFMIIYFGRREEAKQYYYEFQIRSRAQQDIRRVKFVEPCVSDCEDLSAKLEDESCIALSFKTIKHYLNNGAIPFRFIVKKFEKEAEAVVLRRTSENEAAADGSNKPAKPKPIPFVFTDKGKLKQNLNRSSSVASFAGANSPGKHPLRRISVPARPMSASISPNSASPGTKIPEFSSINRMGISGQDSPIIHQEPSPLMSPSINRLDAFWPN
ncbi:uncharacterized protein LOC135707339 isoform X2 [Ochlerotatus camptorhynchus]|uniref:uncharacterized protein LOC135707339 isoform X2 n=1 Tax=Ochlerotatus camptorhynchus TaxID=644619 RepID=UPI0031D9301F